MFQEPFSGIGDWQGVDGGCLHEAQEGAGGFAQVSRWRNGQASDEMRLGNVSRKGTGGNLYIATVLSSQTEVIGTMILVWQVLVSSFLAALIQ